jgi:hypothetical protein
MGHRHGSGLPLAVKAVPLSESSAKLRRWILSYAILQSYQQTCYLSFGAFIANCGAMSMWCCDYLFMFTSPLHWCLDNCLKPRLAAFRRWLQAVQHLLE